MLENPSLCSAVTNLTIRQFVLCIMVTISVIILNQPGKSDDPDTSVVLGHLLVVNPDIH